MLNLTSMQIKGENSSMKKLRMDMLKTASIIYGQ